MYEVPVLPGYHEQISTIVNRLMELAYRVIVLKCGAFQGAETAFIKWHSRGM
jgi:hypothetical protein